MYLLMCDQRVAVQDTSDADNHGVLISFAFLHFIFSVEQVTYGSNKFRHGQEYIFNFDYRPLGVTEFYEIQIGCS